MSEGKKRGPKPKPKSQRIKAYAVGLSGNDIKYIEQQARKIGINTSEFVRMLLNSHREDSEN